MTDADLIAKKLAFIEACVRELREEAHPERIGHDLREERFIAHTLQLAIQAALDVASHIVSARRLGEPSSNRELFTLLGRDGWVAPERVPVLRDMAAFRNVLVHGYLTVDLRILRDVVENRLADLLAFADGIRARLAPESGTP